jgi:hypothetical protein
MASTTLRQTFAELLRPSELELLQLRHRWHAIEVFVEELHQANGGLRFEIHDEAAWNWMLDARDMVVIRLASWVKSIWGKGGLLGRLAADGKVFRELNAEYPRSTDHTSEARQRRRAAFARLFPSAKRRPTAAELELVRKAVYTHLEPVLRDRSANRAHPYEGDDKEALFHQNSEMEEHLLYAEKMFNDLRICAGAGVVVYHNHLGDTSVTAAPDLVDAILLGGSDRIDMVTRPDILDGTRYRAQRRERIYAALRAAAVGRAPEESFNTDADIARLLPPYNEALAFSPDARSPRRSRRATGSGAHG